MTDELWPNATFYRWEKFDYPSGDPIPCPEAGEGSYMGYEWREVTDPDEADVVEVPYTVWGDYVGSTVERSNYRVFLEDYPDTFVEVSGGYWSHVLYLPMGKLAGEDGEYLKEQIQGLFDYPLLSDEDHSNLEMDLAWEAWDQYLRSDIEREWNIDPEWSDTWTDEDWSFVRERYYSLTYDQNYGPESESADGMVFPFHEAVIETLTNELNTLGLEHDPRRPNPNQLEMRLEP